MKYFYAAVCFLISAAALFAAAKGEAFFAGRLGARSTKRIPRWFGRLWCFIVAVFALWLGVLNLQ